MNEVNIKYVIDWLLRERFKNSRIETLKDILYYYEIPFFIQEEDESSNIIISIGRKNHKKTVIAAHYDVFPESLGINDNSCSIAILVKFCQEALYKNIQKNIDVVFFDKEESGLLGSRDYILKYKDNIKEALLFDIIGYKDVILASGGMSKISDMMFNHNVKLLKFGLPSDNINFISNDIPVTLITGAAKEDIKDNNDYTYSIVPQASFYKTFHNKEWDNDIQYIHFDLIDKVYLMLCDLYIK